MHANHPVSSSNNGIQIVTKTQFEMWESETTKNSQMTNTHPKSESGKEVIQYIGPQRQDRREIL